MPYSLYDASLKTVITVSDDKIPESYKIWDWDHAHQRPIYTAPETAITPDLLDNYGNHKLKVLFETELAYAVLKNAHIYMPTLLKIGGKLAKLIKSKEPTYEEKESRVEYREKLGRIFSHFLYPNRDNLHFGRIGVRETSPDLNTIYKTGLVILESEKRIERILTMFLSVGSLLTVLPKDKEISALYKTYDKLNAQCQFAKIIAEGSRIKSHSNKITSNRFGICDKKINLPYQIELHNRAIEYMRLDTLLPTAYTEEVSRQQIPYVGGPSAHAAKTLLNIYTIDNTLTLEEQRIVSLTVAAMLIAAGAHSFHEVFVMAKTLGLPYESGNYRSALPETFTKTADYRKLALQFKDIIGQDSALAETPLHTSICIPNTPESKDHKIQSSTSSALVMLSPLPPSLLPLHYRPAPDQRAFFATPSSPTDSLVSADTETPSRSPNKVFDSPSSITDISPMKPNLFKRTFDNFQSSQQKKGRSLFNTYKQIKITSSTALPEFTKPTL